MTLWSVPAVEPWSTSTGSGRPALGASASGLASVIVIASRTVVGTLRGIRTERAAACRPILVTVNARWRR